MQEETEKTIKAIHEEHLKIIKEYEEKYEKGIDKIINKIIELNKKLEEFNTREKIFE